MVYLFRLILFIMILPVGYGCASKHFINDRSPLDLQSTSLHNRSIQKKFSSATQEGVFYHAGKIYIKTQGKPFQSLLDELAYKMRFNYTILTELPPLRLDFPAIDPEQARRAWAEKPAEVFESLNALFSMLENIFNYNSAKDQAQYRFLKSTDGYMLCRVQTDDPSHIIDDYQNTYKKIFLYNLTTEEASTYIKSLYPELKDSVIEIKSQNAIIVKANQKQLNEIGDILFALDSDYPQVLIETQVFEYDDSVGKDIGTAISYLNGPDDKMKHGFNLPLLENVTTNIPNGFFEYNDEDKKQFLLTSLALNSDDGRVRIVAEPRLLMKSGTPGSIELTTEKTLILEAEKYASTENIKAGLLLEITPTILSENTILLKIHLTRDEFIPNIEPDVALTSTKNEVTTCVVVNDGELLSIGGIYLNKARVTSSGIPYLKNIPWVGFLFGSKGNYSNRSVTEFMIRPTIKKLYQKNIDIIKTVDTRNNKFDQLDEK